MTLIDNSYYFNKYDIVLLMMVCLMSYEQTSCTLLDPMTDEGKPNIKLFIKAIHSENYCSFFVYDSADRID